MRPSIIALTGLPGTGKTGLGTSLYPHLSRDFAYLDIDTLTQPLVRSALEVSGMTLAAADASGALRALRDAQYACLWNQVRELVSFQRSVVVVAPMTHELEDPPAFRSVVASLRPARFVLVRTHASPRVVRTRLEQRRDFLDELRLSRWNLDLHRYERRAPLPVHGLDLDTSTQPPRVLAERVLAWLRAQLAGSERPDDSQAVRSGPARIRA
jgi:predicted kinase